MNMMKKSVFVLLVAGAGALGCHPNSNTVFLTVAECKQLGGDAGKNEVCGSGKSMCTTKTVSPVTNEVTTHQLCCSD
jgi:uncharacterized lipoprotein NlpE involved in copper resistance